MAIAGLVSLVSWASASSHATSTTTVHLVRSASRGVCLITSMISDRAVKANVASVDPVDMLNRVRDLPIATWNYTSDDAAIRHIGPMAQDFAATFGVGGDDRHIHPIDGHGVALAAIQGLAAEVERLREENATLAARLAALEQVPDGG